MQISASHLNRAFIGKIAGIESTYTPLEKALIRLDRISTPPASEAAAARANCSAASSNLMLINAIMDRRQQRCQGRGGQGGRNRSVGN